MQTLDEQLYYACSNYCEALTQLMIEKDKIRTSEFFFDAYTSRKMIEFHEDKVRHYYTNLKEIIEKIENGGK